MPQLGPDPKVDAYNESECAVDNSSDKIMLTESLSLARDILNYINRQVDEHEKEQRLFTIYNKLDARSYTLVNSSKFKVICHVRIAHTLLYFTTNLGDWVVQWLGLGLATQVAYSLRTRARVTTVDGRNTLRPSTAVTRRRRWSTAIERVQTRRTVSEI